MPMTDARISDTWSVSGMRATGSGATNNTFAGRNRKLLFITGPVDSVTAVRMRVRGAADW